MALVKCSECGKEISSVAAACPNCGYSEKAQVIELTSKKYKVRLLFFVGLIVIGVIVYFIGLAFSTRVDHRGEISYSLNNYSSIGMWLFLIGFIGFIVTKLKIWWHHK